MRNQIEMYNYLKDVITSHSISIEDNKIIAKRKYRIGDSFASFIITYLKNGKISVKCTSYPSKTLRFNNDNDLINHLGCMSSSKISTITQ